MINFEELDEGLTIAGRRKRARTATRNKAKLKHARKRSSRKTAPMQTILKRAMRRARNSVASNLLVGRKKSTLSATSKSGLEKRIGDRKGLVQQKFRRAIPKVRSDDRKRK